MSEEVYSNCYFCGEELVKYQGIVKVHQYFYCDEECLYSDAKIITLGECDETFHDHKDYNN